MSRYFRAVAGTFAIVLLAPASLSAQVTVGTAQGAMCQPFSCSGLTRYQQLYRASLFANNLSFNTITFAVPGMVGIDGSILAGNYAIRFATIAQTALGANADANLGLNSQLFFSGVVAGGGLSFTGNTYTYDPSAGSLIMDVVLSGQTGRNGYMSSDGTGMMPRYTLTANGGSIWSDGLVTTFSTTGPPPETTVTPEPITMTLLGTGLAGIAVARRRKRRVQEAETV